MALKIRLARGGSKKRPFYRMVVAEASSPRDGRFVEKLGTYNPLLASEHPERVVLNIERIKHWLSVGALPSDRVYLFLSRAGIVEKKVYSETPKKSAPKKKAQERLKAESAAKEASIAAEHEAKERAVAEAAAAAEAAAMAAAQPAIEETPVAEVGPEPEITVSETAPEVEEVTPEPASVE